MATPLQNILTAIRTKDYAVATEGIGQVMQTKIENRLAQERISVGHSLVKEASLNSLQLKCLECGKKFKSTNPDPKCPECGGYDIDLSEAFPSNSMKRHVCKSCGTPWHGPIDDAECPKCGRPEWLGKQDEDYNPGRDGIVAAKLDNAIAAAQKRGDTETAKKLINRRDRLGEN